MTVGIIILAHEHLHRTRALAKAIASRKVKVMIHVDAGTNDAAFDDLRRGLEKNAHIDFCARLPCEWGRFSLVRAGMNAADALMSRWPNVSHVMQISGSCLPVRPIGELVEFLERHPGRDFVESVPAHEGNWVVDGLCSERFTLYFPFSFKRQRMLFDAAVELQRRLGFSRRIPSGIKPHLGSQWWCLSKRTLKAIFADPALPEYDRYFSKCWIPDEGYLPTLAQKHSKDMVCRSLTLSRFDDQGKPHLFYDDHRDMLEQTDHFFARKIWHGADKLYHHFLGKKRSKTDRPLETEFGLDLLFEEARARRCGGRKGRLTVGRFPAAAHERQPSTVGRYGSFVGFGHLFDGFEGWLSKTTGTVAHGRLFKKNAVHFAQEQQVMCGGISANPRIRDHNPEQFLCNLLWNIQDRHQSLMLELSDSTRMCEFVINDPNAQLFVMRGGWILELFARNIKDLKLLKNQVRRLAKAEAAFEREVEKSARGNLTYISLFDIVTDPDRVLLDIQKTLRPEVDLRPGASLAFRDLSGLRDYLIALQSIGVDTSVLGTIPHVLPGEVPLVATPETAALG